MDRGVAAYAGMATAVTLLVTIYISPYLPLDALVLGLLGIWVVSYSVGGLEAPRTPSRRVLAVRSRVAAYAEETGTRSTAGKGWLAENPFEESVISGRRANLVSESASAVPKRGAGDK